MASQLLFFLIITIFLAITTRLWWQAKEENIVFYMHDIVNESNATVKIVAGENGKLSNLLGFGTVLVMDDLLTETPDLSSTVVGRAKGLYSNSDVNGGAIHFVLSVVFEKEIYSGSTLELQGTDLFVRSPTSEVSVVGGTGRLRYARGYSIITIHSAVGLDGIIKFDTTFRLS